MPIVLCPYELTRQAPVAQLAILLAEQPHPVRRSVVTWAPRPGIGPERDDAPLALLKAWAWSEPLWAQGLIAPIRPGTELEVEVDATVAEWSHLPGLRPLVEVLRATTLSEIERDIAQCGTKPAIRVLVTALLESWASTMGAWSFGPGLASNRMSRRREAPIIRLSLPIPLGADGDLLLDIRGALEVELDRCRRALAEVAHHALTEPSKAREVARDLLQPAFADYAQQFNMRIEHWNELAGGLGLPFRPIEILMRAELNQPGRTIERAAGALGGGRLPSIDSGDGVLALRPGLAISTRLSPWDVSSALHKSADA